MCDLECPYCGNEQDTDHDDVNEQDTVYEDECESCGKYFTISVDIDVSYTTSKADCLNGSPHKYKPTHTYPKRLTRMRCKDCEKERGLSREEVRDIPGVAESIIEFEKEMRKYGSP